MFFAIGQMSGRLEKKCPSVTDQLNLNAAARGMVISTLCEAFVSLTSLVLAILGIIGMIHGMPAAASYALFSVTGFISLVWIVLAIYSKGGSVGLTANILRAAFSTNRTEGNLCHCPSNK